MAIEFIHSFLVHPAKHNDNPPVINGTDIQLMGSLFDMLTRVYNRSNRECKIDIQFLPDEDGNQVNPCRDLIIAHSRNPRIESGRDISNALQMETTHRSGLGLLFIIKGREGRNHKIVISRFPADEGVIVEEDASNFSVEFIERVFMKSATAYKSVLYISDSFNNGFWDGKAVDRQISGKRELSEYWIRDFLKSELKTTGPAGSMRMALALRESIKRAETLNEKRDLISISEFVRNIDGLPTSAREIVRRLNLSQNIISKLESSFSRPELMDEIFPFDLDEYTKHISFRYVEINNGGVMIAEDSKFNEVFPRQEINPSEGIFRFITEGKVIDEELRRVK